MNEQNSPSHPPWSVLGVVSTGVFMSTMDSSMINVALPVIMESFHSPLALTQWVMLIYLLTITVLLLIWGSLADRWSRAAIYSHGMLIFTIGSLFCSLAPDIYPLIGCRLLQALGASMMMAVGPALIKAAFPPSQLGRGLGLIGVATSLGLMTGPLISGLLIHWAHWRAIFLVTVPVGAICFLLGRHALAGLHQEKHAPVPASPNHPFDLKGFLLWTGAITLSLLFATHATSFCGRDSFTLVVNPAVSLLLLLGAWSLLWYHERGCPQPLLPLALLRQRFFLVAIITAILSFTVLFSVLILMPFYLDRILKLPPDKIGTVMMAIPLCVFLISPLAGKIHDRTGARRVATAGLCCCLLSVLLLTGLTVSSSPAAIAARLALLGLGQALFLSPNSAAALASVPDKQTAITASLLATARNLGMLLGTAFTGLIFTCYFARLTGGLDLRDFSAPLAPQFMAAMHATLWGVSLLAFGAAIISWLRGETQG